MINPSPILAFYYREENPPILFGNELKNPGSIHGIGWQTVHLTEGEIEYWSQNDKVANSGIRTGYQRNDGRRLIALDFDWTFIYPLWYEKFKSRAQTFICQTPSIGARVLYWTKEEYAGKPFEKTIHLEYLGNQYAAIWEWAINNIGEKGDYKIFQDLKIITDDTILKDTTTFIEELLNKKYQFLMYPCIQNHLAKAKKNIFLNHEQSLAILNFMVVNECTDEEIHNLRRMIVDYDKHDPKGIVKIYDEGITNSQIKNGRKFIEGGGLPFPCVAKELGKRGLIEIFDYNGTNCIKCPRRIRLLEGKNNLLELKADDFFEKTKEGRIIKSSFIPRKLGEKLKNEYRFASIDKNLPIYYYREETGAWDKNGERKIREKCYQILEDCAIRNHIEETIAYIRDTSYIDPIKFDHDVTKIPCLNGTINLVNGEITAHDPELYALAYIPHNYDKEKDCPEIKKFFNEVVRSEDIDFWQEWLGYHLWREYTYHKALLCLGGGRNGKSTALKLIRAFVGRDNAEAHTLQEIVSDRFAKADLYGKLANIAADISAEELKRTDKFKAATGGDLISAQEKFKAIFNFINYAKLTFSANQIPKEEADKSEAFFVRWQMINFPNKFDEGNQDPDKIKKITTEDEMSGLINWAIQGLHRLIENRKFTNTPTTEEIQEKWDQGSNPEKAFYQNCIQIDAEAEPIKKEDVHVAYVNYCKNNKITYVGLTTFCSRIYPESQGSVQTIQIKNPNPPPKRIKVWKGIKLKCNLEDDEQKEICTGCTGSPPLPTRHPLKLDDINKNIGGGYKTPPDPVHPVQAEVSSSPEPPKPNLEEKLKKILSLLSLGVSSTDYIAGKCDLKSDEASRLLAMLTREGQVFQPPGSDLWRRST
jgi:putative DNA primase/helicase